MRNLEKSKNNGTKQLEINFGLGRKIEDHQIGENLKNSLSCCISPGRHVFGITTCARPHPVGTGQFMLVSKFRGSMNISCSSRTPWRGHHFFSHEKQWSFLQVLSDSSHVFLWK